MIIGIFIIIQHTLLWLIWRETRRFWWVRSIQIIICILMASWWNSIDFSCLITIWTKLITVALSMITFLIYTLLTFSGNQALNTTYIKLISNNIFALEVLNTRTFISDLLEPLSKVLLVYLCGWLLSQDFQFPEPRP